MSESSVRVRHNVLAIVLAAVVSFLFEAFWYSVFMEGWLSGIGRTKQWLVSPGFNPAIQYATALVCAAVVALTLSTVTQLTGPQTAFRGIKVGAGLWFGLVLTTWSTEYIFELKPPSLLGINAGFSLCTMVLMGAIVGGWKAKPKG